VEVERGTCQNGSKDASERSMYETLKRLECGVSDMHPPACFHEPFGIQERNCSQYSGIQSILTILLMSLSKVETRLSFRSRGSKI